MKSLILLLFPLTLLAQKKGDNTIIISHDVPMSKIKAVLFKSGYAITTSDTAFISTSPKEAPTTVVSMIIMIARIDTVTYLKAQVKSAVAVSLSGVNAENNYSLLSFNPKKASEEGRAWLELDRIAKELSPALIYVKQ
jgi:hypothetical protein